MTYAEIYGLSTGDRVVIPLFQTGLSKHHAVYLGTDEFGQEWFAENRIFRGVQMVPANIFFANGSLIDRIEHFGGNAFQREQVIQRALSLVGKPYHLIGYNCEHFVNEVQSGNPVSSQVKTAALLAGIFLVGITIARS